MMDITLPKKKRGRPTEAERQATAESMREFASQILELQTHIPHKASSRGWCYLLENKRIINKDQFDLVEGCINDCRKLGLLPIDFVLVEEAREFKNTSDSQPNYFIQSPEQQLLSQISDMVDSSFYYSSDLNFWDAQDCYIQMLVEKIDLRELFMKVCVEYHIPIATAKGWSSLLQRNDMAQRFRMWEARGKQCVLLYCGDFDPAGHLISDFLKKDLDDLILATHYDPVNLKVDRFGLEYDFIISRNITWIDNLISGRKKPPDKSKKYVRDYIAKYGERKVEANALDTMPDAAEELVRKAINKYLPEDANDRIEQDNEYGQSRIDDILEKSDVHSFIDEMESIKDDLYDKVEKIINGDNA